MTSRMNNMLLAGKKGLVLNVTNKFSIGWSCAVAAHEHGAEVAVGAQDERMADKVKSLIAPYERMSLVQVDFTKDEDLVALKDTVAERFGTVDFIVHSAAYAPKEDLMDDFIKTSRGGFSIAMDISAFSFVTLCNHLEPVMADDCSVMTMSYLGSTRATMNYKVMGVAKAALEACVRYLAVDLGPRGIRVNTLSPGPINTVAARGVKDLANMIAKVQAVAPLKRPFGQDEVAGHAVYLMSDLSKGMSGQIIFIDSGFNFIGASADM